MTPTLDQIANNPDILRLFLIKQGLKEEFREQLSFSFKFKVEDEQSFLWGHNKSLSARRGGVYSCKFNDENLFYSLALPSFTKSDIEQLKSVLAFIDRLFSNGQPIEKTSSFFFSVMKPIITIKTDAFTLFCKNQHSFSLSNKHITVALQNLEFETIYSAILNELKIKLENYLKRKLHVIDTDVFKSIIDESIPAFIERLFKDSAVKPVCSETFLDVFDPVTFQIIKKDHEKFNDFQLENDDSYVLNVNDDIYYSIKIDIKNIKVLRKLLSKSMNLADIDVLIHTISMTAFYHNMTTPHEQVTYFKFSRSNIFNMNKVELSSTEFFYEISVGDYSFHLGKEILMQPMNFAATKLTIIAAWTTNELYEKQFEFITADICKVLATDSHNICVRDIKVIEMMLL